MVVLINLRLLLNIIFEFGVLILVEQPLENSLLNLLIVLVFKEFISEEFH